MTKQSFRKTHPELYTNSSKRLPTHVKGIRYFVSKSDKKEFPLKVKENRFYMEL